MNGPLDKETRENLKKSHAASKVVVMLQADQMLLIVMLESSVHDQ